jgi:photosystem II stability/assembly factor-like uncharacterized protein
MRIRNKITLCIICLATIIGLLLGNTTDALAHSPHDVIEDIELSQNFNQDKTLFLVVRGSFLKSTDGGVNWQRVVNGLDNRNQFNSLEISPHNKNILFISSIGDGIYKSQDGGNSWFKANNGLTNLNIDLIAINSYSSSDIVFAAGLKGGLYSTEDGGGNWKEIMSPKVKITAINFFPSKKIPIVAGDDKGHLYISEDGGNSWRKQSSYGSSITEIVVSPAFSADKIFFIGTSKNGVFKTSNGGKSFTSINGGLPEKLITGLAISPEYSTDSKLFISTWHDGFFYSENGGKTWRKSVKGLTRDGQADGINVPHFTNLKVSRNFNQDKTLFLEGFDGLFQSIDGGQTWKQLDTLSTKIIVGLGISPNYHHDSTIAVTTYLGGMFISRDRGLTWEATNQGLEEKEFYTKPDARIARLFNVAYSPNYQHDKTLFTARWKEVFVSSDGGKSWQESTLNGEKGKSKVKFKDLLRLFIISPSPNYAVDQTVYLGTRKGEIFRSLNAGKTFSVINNIHKPIKHIAISPNFKVDRSIFIGTDNAIYKSLDGGQKWKLIANVRGVSGLAVSPNYKLDGIAFYGSEFGAFKTINHGDNWFKLSDANITINDSVEAISISPNFETDQTLLITVRGKGLFKSIDGGQNFKQISEDLVKRNYSLANFSPHFFPTASPIQFSPSYATDRTIYGFSGTEILRSMNSGSTWEHLQIPDPPRKILLTSVYLNFRNIINSIHWRIQSSQVLRLGFAFVAALLIYPILNRLKLFHKSPTTRVFVIRSAVACVFFIIFGGLSWL